MDLTKKQFIELEEILERYTEKHGFVRQGNKTPLKRVKRNEGTERRKLAKGMERKRIDG